MTLIVCDCQRRPLFNIIFRDTLFYRGSEKILLVHFQNYLVVRTEVDSTRITTYLPHGSDANDPFQSQIRLIYGIKAVHVGRLSMEWLETDIEWQLKILY